MRTLQRQVPGSKAGTFSRPPVLPSPGRKPGRESDEEIIVFDSTGTALQDAAAAAVVYEKAIRSGAGLEARF